MLNPESDDAGREATLVLFIRHAEQSTMREVDPPLSERGRAQAALLAQRLSSLPISAVVASPLLRARETAGSLADLLGLPVEVMEDLHEARSSHEGHRHVFTDTPAAAMEPQVDDYIGPAMAAIEVLPRFEWGRDGFTETAVEIRERMLRAVDGLVERYPGGIVACFSHGGAINCVTGAYAGITPDIWFVPWHTGVSGLYAKGSTRTLLFVNDSSHLASTEDALSIVASTMSLGAIDREEATS